MRAQTGVTIFASACPYVATFLIVTCFCTERQSHNNWVISVIAYSRLLSLAKDSLNFQLIKCICKAERSWVILCSAWSPAYGRLANFPHTGAGQALSV